jgi:bis(5'-adenosyl)-triphosphatase
MSTLLFSTIDVTRQAFYRTSRTFAFVNLKPVVNGHVLVAPLRPVKRVSDLFPDELTSLALSVQAVGRVIERAYGAQALSIVCQVCTYPLAPAFPLRR